MRRALAFTAILALLLPIGLADAQSNLGPLSGAIVKWVDGADTIRVKSWNTWPQADQILTTDATKSVAGPENFQFKLVVKFRRASDPRTEVTATKIGTMDNDAGAAGVTSAGLMAFPFGAAAGKERTYTDANATMTTKTISSCTVANPTVCLTSTAHTLTTGDLINVSATSGFTPDIAGLQYVTVTDSTHFSIPINVTACSSCAATLNTSRTLTSATAAFTADDVGKNITLSTGGTVCTADLISSNRCQGPKFPTQAAPVTYQGAIIAYVNATTVTVKPSMTINPAGTATLKIDPILRADEDGLELGSGWLTGVDINFWQGAPKPGQSDFEVEINRGVFSIHQGVTLIPKCYLEPSGHLSWPYGRCQGGGGAFSGHGWTRQFQIAAPAAGVDWSATCPAKTHWKIISVRGVFATVGAANRLVALVVDDGGSNISFSTTNVVDQVAATTTVYQWAPGFTPRAITPSAGALRQYVELPIGLEMIGGWRIRPITAGLQVGDTWTSIVLEVEQWNEE